MTAQLRLIDPDQIELNEANPRRRIDDKKMEELVASVLSIGVIQPVVITRRDGKDLLVTGERRVRASIIAGLKEIPAVERELSDKEILELMLVENLQRSDLEPLEEADALNRLVHEHGWKQNELAGRVGRSPGWVSKRIRLLALPPEALDALTSEKITMEDALELLRLRKWPEKIIEALDHRYGYNVKAKVDRLLHEAQREIVQNNAYAKLEAEGKRVYRGEFDTWFRAGSREQALALSKDQEKGHKREKRECLAYAVDKWDGHVRAVCIDPEHWKGEMHGSETDQHEKSKAERKAKKKAKRASDYELVRSLTGSVDELEAYIRERALKFAATKQVQMGSARAFGWKIGRSFDRERLAKEIGKAKGKQLRMWWMVTEALHDIGYGWDACNLLTVIRELRGAGADGDGSEA